MADSWFDIANTLLGAVVGGGIGYVASRLQWKQTLARERALRRRQEFQKVADLTYELIDYVRDYWVNSQHLPLEQFLPAMTGRNPLSRLLAAAVAGDTELQEAAAGLEPIVSNMMGPEYPVPREKWLATSQAINDFGRANAARNKGIVTRD